MHPLKYSGALAGLKTLLHKIFEVEAFKIGLCKSHSWPWRHVVRFKPNPWWPGHWLPFCRLQKKS